MLHLRKLMNSISTLKQYPQKYLIKENKKIITNQKVEM